MSQSIAETLVLFFAVYFIFGFVYSIYFLRIKAPKIDPVFARAKWTVKILMQPAAMIFWPLVACFGKGEKSK